MKILVLNSLKWAFDAFFRPSTLKTDFLKKKLRVGYVYIEESFDTIFQHRLWAGAWVMGYGSGKSPMGVDHC